MIKTEYLTFNKVGLILDIRINLLGNRLKNQELTKIRILVKAIQITQQGLFLLAAYCLRQNKKQLCKQNLALLKDAIIAVFLQFAENEALSHKWQWEQWFKEEKGEPKISQKIDLRDFVCHLLLFYLKDKKQALAMLKKQPFKKEHLNYLERLHTLCAKKSSLKNFQYFEKILQETLSKKFWVIFRLHQKVLEPK